MGKKIKKIVKAEELVPIVSPLHPDVVGELKRLGEEIKELTKSIKELEARQPYIYWPMQYPYPYCPPYWVTTTEGQRGYGRGSSSSGGTWTFTYGANPNGSNDLGPTTGGDPTKVG